MKKFTLFLALMVFYSCSEGSKYENSSIGTFDEESPVVDREVNHLEMQNYTDFSIKKFEEYLELLEIKNNFPKFSDEIDQQINTYTNDRSFQFQLSQKMSNIQVFPVGKLIKTNDSVFLQKLKINYLVNNISEADTIISIIELKKTEIDGKIGNSNRISFKKNR